MLKSVTCENLGCGTLLVITSYQVEEMNFSSCSVGQKDSKSGCRFLNSRSLGTKPVWFLKFSTNPKTKNGKFSENKDWKTWVNIS